jgi:hypothetical protein
MPELHDDMRQQLLNQPDPRITDDRKYARYTDLFGANRWIVIATRVPSGGA